MDDRFLQGRHSEVELAFREGNTVRPIQGPARPTQSSRPNPMKASWPCARDERISQFPEAPGPRPRGTPNDCAPAYSAPRQSCHSSENATKAANVPMDLIRSPNFYLLWSCEGVARKQGQILFRTTPSVGAGTARRLLLRSLHRGLTPGPSYRPLEHSLELRRRRRSPLSIRR